MLHTEERPQPNEKSSIDEQAKSASGDFWDPAIITDLAKSFVNALQYDDGTGLKNDGKFELNLEKPATSSQRPLMHLAPAVILRKRSQRGFIRLLEEIEEAIDKGGEIPEGIKTVITHANDNRPIYEDFGSNEEKPAFQNQEIYFPLPANKEQMQIVNYLERGKGVRVQGPPGTGKSHTITNLICHLLASGKRVLVTSETERALRSLRSKFIGAAEPLSNLAVILLGNDSTSLRELEKSVSAINAKKESWNKKDAEKAIADYEQRLGNARERRRMAENDLRSIRESDVYTHDNKFGCYSGTLQEIAQAVTEQADQFNWFNDHITESLDAKDIIKIDAEVFVRKWHEWNMVEKIDAKLVISNTDGLPSVEQIGAGFAKFNKLAAESEVLKSICDTQLLMAIKACLPEKILDVYQSVQPILSGLRNLKQHVYAWSYEAGVQIVAEQDRVWRELFEITQRELQRCDSVVKEVSIIEVEGVEDFDVRRIKGFVKTALEFAHKGKKLKKSLFNPSAFNEALKEIAKVNIDGHSLNSIETLELLDKWLEAKDAFNVLASNWKSVTVIPPGSMAMQLAQYYDFQEPLELALGLHQKVQISQRLIDDLAKFSAPKWHIYDDVEQFCKTFGFYYQAKTLADSKQLLDKYVFLARSKESTEKNRVGKLEQAVLDQNVAAYHTALESLKKKNKRHKNQSIVLMYARKFRSNLPNTFSDFSQSDGIEAWVSNISNLQAGINWSIAANWVETLCDPKAALKITANIEIYAKQEQDLLGKIAQEKAWSYCIDRLGESQRQALVAWLQAIERVAGGTGIHAEGHRRVARQKLVECQSAIPAWVMPLHRVVDTVHAESELFDVAIIDEASQSGSEALILNYIAKKVVVVGDDKQIRPQNIGVNHGDVDYLRKRYLKDFPHSETFDMKSSYFSQAEVRFPNQVSLKEHFRCMPEIIQFSNNNFYQSAPLIPLKQFGTGRLDPVATEYVEEGYRVGTSSKVYNEPEARKLVERLAECCSDLDYQDKTFGVITLLGHQQAALIEELLLNEIDVEEYEARKIMVGSAYAFQGDERDIIFISMVDAPQDGRRCRAVTSPEKEREFNVAASRAKEQMILFHSATLRDLKEQCLQYRLLSHCLNPSVEQLPVVDMSLNELREIVHKTDRVKGNQPPPFDSWFEIDVFLQLANRGHRIIPQYVVNPYDKSFRIDMVVMGMNGKLAIECDGDHWHGPAEYDRDMARQRELERCGWEFWRVRGGSFYRDQELAMASLWELLNKRGIHPKGYQPSVSKPEQPAFQDDERSNIGSEFETINLDGSVEESVQSDRLDLGDVKNQGVEPLVLYSQSPDDKAAPLTVKITAQDLRPADIQSSILTILSEQPNYSATVKSMATKVCKHLGIVTRGAPRRDLERKISNSLGVLKRQNKIEEYKAKNIRVRLTSFL